MNTPQHMGDAAPREAPLAGVHVVSIALNLPGPVAVQRLQSLGARVTTVLPPSGDPMQKLLPDLFRELHEGQEVQSVDMRSDEGRHAMTELLRSADVFVTSHRSGTLKKLGLDFETVRASNGTVVQADIVGFPGERSDVPGHDINYQAEAGLLEETQVPRNLLADMHGSERAVSDILGALYARQQHDSAQHVVTALSDAGTAIALPLRHGMTQARSPLGGSSPFYSIYPTADGRVAVGALEPHFAQTLVAGLGLDTGEDIRRQLQDAFREDSAPHWQQWGEEHGVPVTAVKDLSGRARTA